MNYVTVNDKSKARLIDWFIKLQKLDETVKIWDNHIKRTSLEMKPKLSEM